MRTTYPFSAIIGQDSMKTALLLNAVDPSIGGVLIQGHKGTGKSTAVRALADILPPISVVDGCPFNCPPDRPDQMHDGCKERLASGTSLTAHTRAMPLVDLPLSATEDRLVGTLHVEHALKTGERRYEPGLLAAANRGILYVDEVNLLEDHLVDMLLDSAASGVNLIEREGISYTHPARFMLIGTMNPEEGELRPQFLDRFGLCVTVEGMTDPRMRQAIIRQRLAFEAEPEAFLAQWTPAEELLTRQIQQARDNLASIEIPDAMLDLAVRLSLDVEVHGHRSDIAMLKAARALAAILEKATIDEEDMKEAAHLVLPHRIQAVHFGNAKAVTDQVDAALAKALNPDAPLEVAEDQDGEWDDAFFMDDELGIPGNFASGTPIFSLLKKKLKNRSSTPTSSSVPPTST